MIKIKNEELVKELIGEIKDFPKYTTQIMNLANQNAHRELLDNCQNLLKNVQKKLMKVGKNGISQNILKLLKMLRRKSMR